MIASISWLRLKNSVSDAFDSRLVLVAQPCSVASSPVFDSASAFSSLVSGSAVGKTPEMAGVVAELKLGVLVFSGSFCKTGNSTADILVKVCGVWLT